MARGLNKVMLIGNLGKDPEMQYTQNGIARATFSVATSYSWKDQEGNQQEKTDWHNIVVWRKLAEICKEYLKKGSKVYLEGKISTRSYDDKTGTKRYITEIVADEMLMLDSAGPRNSEQKEHTATPQTEPESGPPPTEPDLPF